MFTKGVSHEFVTCFMFCAKAVFEEEFIFPVLIQKVSKSY